MTPVGRVEGVAAPLPRGDIDTDVIIPQDWLITTEREGLGKGLFANLRYLPGSDVPDPEFVLNSPYLAGAAILVAGPNYGCGSSREHAVWAHLDFGLRAVIAASFGPIFRENAAKNGLLAIELPQPDVDAIMTQLNQLEGARMTVDLLARTITAPNGHVYRFTVDEAKRAALIAGEDAIDSTLSLKATIQSFEDRDRLSHPWLWEVPAD